MARSSKLAHTIKSGTKKSSNYNFGTLVEWSELPALPRGRVRFKKYVYNQLIKKFVLMF